MQKIIVGVDGSPASNAAAAWALHEARDHGAQLEVVLAWEFPPMSDFYTPTGAELQDEADLRLTRFMADLDVEGIDLVARAVEGNPATVLLDASSEADLLVVGSRGHTAFVGMMLGSVSLRIVTHARGPVVIVPPAPS